MSFESLVHSYIPNDQFPPPFFDWARALR